MKRMLLYISRYRQFLLYGVIGSFTASLDFVVFTLLIKLLGLWYIAANCISVLVGISTSFLLNRNFNFKVKDKVGRRFSIFLAVGLGGLLLSNIILYVCTAKVHLDALPAKLLSIVLVVFFQFLLNKYVTFKKPTKR